MRTFALFAAFLTLTALPVSAWHGSGEPLIDAVPIDGVHWVAWRVVLATPGKIVVETEATVANVEIVAMGASLMGADGSDAETSWIALQAYPSHVFVQTFGGSPRLDTSWGYASGDFKAAITWNVVPVGEYVVIGIVTGVGAVTGGEISLRSDGGATLLARTEGTSAFAAVARDFSGEANVRVGNPLVTATAIVDASNERVVEDRLFAFYWRHTSTTRNPLHQVLCDIRYDGPDGGGAGLRYYFLDNRPAGTYTFRVPQCADVGMYLLPTQLFVIGADVALPT